MFVKNPTTKMVINTDDTYYKSLLAMRSAQRVDREKTIAISQEMEALKDELTEIKELLKRVIN